MNLTQALGKLYETLSGQKPKNSQTKIIMDIAEGIEDGSISVGGDEHISYCTLHIDNTEKVGANAGIGVIQNGELDSYWTVPYQTSDLTVVLYDGKAYGSMLPNGLGSFTVSGNIESISSDVIITGDGTITLSKSGGGDN